MTPVTVVRALTLYLYNVSPVEIVIDVYGEDIHPDYATEKIHSFSKRSFASFFGGLDSQHQERLVEAAMKRYGDEAERRQA